LVNVEAVKVKSYVREDLVTNYLKVVTDFSQHSSKRELPQRLK
jgi:hypothetical protein